MKDLLETLVKSIVDLPEEVTVNETTRNDITVLEIKVAQNDTGKVIGKQGKIAKAIRTVMKAAAMNENKKVVVEIL